MDFIMFKDIVFDLINECDQFDIKDLTVREKEDKIYVVFEDRSQVEIGFRKIDHQNS